MRNKVDKQTGISMDIMNRPQFIDAVLTHYGEKWRYRLSTIDKWVICWANANADLENKNIFKESILCKVYQQLNGFMIKIHLADFDLNAHHLFIYDKWLNGPQNEEETINDILHNEVTYNVPTKQYNEEYESFNTESGIINHYFERAMDYDERIS